MSEVNKNGLSVSSSPGREEGTRGAAWSAGVADPIGVGQSCTKLNKRNTDHRESRKVTTHTYKYLTGILMYLYFSHRYMRLFYTTRTDCPVRML